ncbi:hypothetical protein Fot_10799 [Forsythia ovata]|uniref:Uncharacterized protein n=1 Tax=Forsythia ovata TaxID=205694 RepID=A0ABD1WHW0_9LAMI
MDVSGFDDTISVHTGEVTTDRRIDVSDEPIEGVEEIVESVGIESIHFPSVDVRMCQSICGSSLIECQHKAFAFNAGSETSNVSYFFLPLQQDYIAFEKQSALSALTVSDIYLIHYSAASMTSQIKLIPDISPGQTSWTAKVVVAEKTMAITGQHSPVKYQNMVLVDPQVLLD